MFLAAAIGNVAINLTKEEELNDVGLLSETQVQEVIKLSEGEKLEFDTTKTFLDLFEGIVKDLPDHPAVVDIFSSYTYKELDMASDAIATYLLRQGVKKNDFVVIKMDRVKEFAAATLGVYKAGACYVPIDPAYPEERIKYMEENSETKFILNEAFIEKILKEVTNPEHVNKATPDGNAYMIYTSGSTGKPKGSILHHKGLMNVVMGIKATFGLVPEDRISAHRSFSFDAHVADFYPVLSSGATLYLIPEEIRKEPDQIYEFLLKNKITGGSYATAMLRIMHGNYELKQRYISGGGEALLDTVSEDVQVYNEYGPTECTVDSSIFTLEKGKNYETIPIGRAMVNGWLFIVDKAER